MRRCTLAWFSKHFDRNAPEPRGEDEESTLPPPPQPHQTAADFVSLCQTALKMFLPPKVTNFTLPELAVYIRRVEPHFQPRHYGHHELRSLVQQCKFIGFARGRYHVVRDVHRARAPIMTDNSTWSYVEPLTPHRNASLSSPHGPFGNPSAKQTKQRRNSYTALSLKLSRMTMKKPRPKRNYLWGNDAAPGDNTFEGMGAGTTPSMREGFAPNYQPQPEFGNQKFFRDGGF